MLEGATRHLRPSAGSRARRRFFDRPLPAWLVFGGLIGIGCSTPQRSVTIANRSNENVRVIIDDPDRDGLDVTIGPGGMLNTKQYGFVLKEISISRATADVIYTDHVSFADEGGRSAYLWIDLVAGQPKFVKKTFTNDWPGDVMWMLTEPLTESLFGPRTEPPDIYPPHGAP
jgi:hypothetical protein